MYFAAKQNEFQLLEIPTYEKRDKKLLEQKVSGASDTYNVFALSAMCREITALDESGSKKAGHSRLISSRTEFVSKFEAENFHRIHTDPHR